MKKGISKFSIIILSAALIFTACGKKKTDPQPADDTAVQTQNGNDDSNASSESDAALTDANTAISGSMTMNGARVAAYPVIDGASSITYDSSVATGNTIVITYDGTTKVNGRTRTGTLTAHMPSGTSWTTAGATLTLTFTNLKATRVSDGKSLTINGTKTVTNVSGGNIKTLAIGSGSLIHKIRSTNMTLTFDDGTVRTWNVARTRTTTRSATSSFSISITGDTTIASHTQVAMWGTTRAGNTFYSMITSPIVWNNTACSILGNPYFAPVSGTRIIQGLDHAVTITMGVTTTGAAATAGTCPYGFKIDWVNAKGESKEVIRPYL
jgi:hypothetical protein